MILAHRRDDDVVPTNGEAVRCERCKRLEAENDRLRELVRLVAALASEEDLAEKLIAAPSAPANRW